MTPQIDLNHQQQMHCVIPLSLIRMEGWESGQRMHQEYSQNMYQVHLEHYNTVFMLDSSALTWSMLVLSKARNQSLTLNIYWHFRHKSATL